MKRAVWIMGALALACAPGKPKVPDFEGRWLLATSSELNDSRETKKVRVWASGNRFRVVSEESEEAFAQSPAVLVRETVFDGKALHTKTTFPPDRDGTIVPPDLRSESADERGAAAMRFWTKTYLGEAGAGGRVAGRDTKLYAVKSKEKHQEINVQAWLDAETGIVLKSQMSLYSPQVGAIVHQETTECEEIRFAPVPENVFMPPR